jgi:hypothetical protein
MATAADVNRAVAAAFAEGVREGALAALKRYRWHERSRVQLAIVVLARGDPAEVRRLVRAANEDYRDVLFWAEYPEESGTGTRRGLAARYRRLGVPVPEDLR